MRKRMLAAVLYGKEDVRLEEIEHPHPAAGEVVVRVDTALTCGTDLKVFQRGYHAKMIRPPSVFGHELAGVVEEIGAGVKNISVGDRVVAANSAPCGKCFFCERDQHNLCEDMVWLNGAYAQFIRVPPRIVQKNLVRVPKSLPLRTAALAEPLACVVRGANDIGIGPNVKHTRRETVAIIGAGPIGLMFLCLAKRAAHDRVIVIGRGSERLKIAKRLGADVVVDASAADWQKQARAATTGERGADVVIEAVGKPETWEAALALARKGGRVNLFGGPPVGTEASFDTNLIHYGDVQLRSSFHHTPQDIRSALALLEEGVVRAEDFVNGERPLGHLPEVLATMTREKRAVKVAILPPR